MKKSINPQDLEPCGTCIIHDPDAHSLYVQTTDAYGHQMEIVMDPYKLTGYIHPQVRRNIYWSHKQAGRMMERMIHIAEQYPTLLANQQGDGGRGKNAGLVQFVLGLVVFEEPYDELMRCL